MWCSYGRKRPNRHLATRVGLHAKHVTYSRKTRIASSRQLFDKEPLNAAEERMKVEDYIRSIPDFPHEGIIFRDVSTLFGDPRGFRMAIDLLLHPFIDQPIDHVAGVEARGFIVGGAIAHQLSVGFIPVRKKGKLPGKTIEQEYKLEYGEAIVELHEDAAKPGDKVLIVDDLLATGGTAEAAIKLFRRLGAEVVGCAFIVDLPDLGGRERLKALDAPIQTLCSFEGE